MIQEQSETRLESTGTSQGIWNLEFGRQRGSYRVTFSLWVLLLETLGGVLGWGGWCPIRFQRQPRVQIPLSIFLFDFRLELGTCTRACQFLYVFSASSASPTARAVSFNNKAIGPKTDSCIRNSFSFQKGNIILTVHFSQTIF